jgi:hypothetical protein
MAIKSDSTRSVSQMNRTSATVVGTLAVRVRDLQEAVEGRLASVEVED